MSNGHSLICHQNIGTAFEGVYYVESAYVKQTVQKKDFMDLMLRDKSGVRNVKYWGKIDGLTKGSFVFISANVEDYKGNPSIIAKNIEKTDEPADLSDYIPAYEKSGANDNATCFDTIRALLKDLEEKTGNFTAGKLIDEVYGNAGFFQKFVVAPGSDKPHYGCQGGLLANTVRVANICVVNADSFNLTDQEKINLLAAALLCRIGAIEAFEFDNCMPTQTKKGILIGMNNLTMSRVFSALKRVVAALTKENKTIDSDTVVRIMHAITSHEDSTVKPMTKEAMVLNVSYKTDSEMVHALDFIESDTNLSEEFTAYDPSTSRKYYTGNRQ